MRTKEHKALALAAIDKLRPLVDSGDWEEAHSDADRVLCDLLNALGFGDVVTQWEAVPKWYA